LTHQLGGVLGIVIVLVLWTVVALDLHALRVIPTPIAVAGQMLNDRSYILPNAVTSLREALIGYFWGNLLAVLAAILFVQVRTAERILMRLAIASYCVPLVAIAPILVVVLSGDGPKAALAALSVFFTTLIATVLGLRSADQSSLDVVKVAGGGSWATFRKIRVWASLPSLLGGLRIAAPAALLGAIIGEYLGADRGLGAAMIEAESSFQVNRTWALALVVSALAGGLYLTVSLLARVLTPWAGSGSTMSLGAIEGTQEHGLGRVGSALRETAGFVLSIVVVVAVWYGFIHAAGLNSFFAKDPFDVFRYLVSDAEAAAHREVLIGALGQTMVDAFVGFIVGTAVATLVAGALVVSSSLERTFMPIAIVLRSVPLVAMTPLLTLVFGRGLVGVTAVVGLVTFFPTLVNLTVGLRSAPELACDVVRSCGGGSVTILWKVRAPYALPSLFASARIAVPAAIGGATLAEWLATGNGLGSLIVVSYSASDFNELWAAAVLVVGVSVALYALIAMAEGVILRRQAA
jgi:ABC-type nitrate/sulfonate/bicarbonate transport system permease component